MTRRPLAVAAALVGALVVLLGGAPGTWALFTDSASVTAGPTAASAFTAGVIAPPTAPGTSQASTTTVTLTWAATTVGTVGGSASSYDVLRFATAGTSTSVTVCTGVTGLTCVDGAAPAGTSYYVLRARVGDSWTRDSTRVPYVPDTTAPTVVITTPLNTCSGTTVACGTSADTGGGTVAKVDYTLRRTRVGAITGSTTYACWSGSGWVADTTGSCTFAAATGTTSWLVPGARGTAYGTAFLYNDSFTLAVRATDSFGNVGATVTAGYAT